MRIYECSYETAGAFPKPVLGFFRGPLAGESIVEATQEVVKERKYRYYDVEDISGVPTVVRKSQVVIDAIIAAKQQLVEQYKLDQAQKAQDIADNLPSWSQAKTAINNAFPDTKQNKVITGIARIVYWLAKNTVD